MQQVQTWHIQYQVSKSVVVQSLVKSHGKSQMQAEQNDKKHYSVTVEGDFKAFLTESDKVQSPQSAIRL
jgi:hypothetical protein